MKIYQSLIKNSFDNNSFVIETSFANHSPIIFWKMIELNLKTSFYVIDELKKIEMLKNELEHYIKRGDSEIKILRKSFFKKNITLILYFELQNKDIPKINKLLTGYSELIDLLFIDIRREKIIHFYYNKLKVKKDNELSLQQINFIISSDDNPHERTFELLRNWLDRKNIEFYSHFLKILNI